MRMHAHIHVTEQNTWIILPNASGFLIGLCYTVTSYYLAKPAVR
jgi:hypothetical protein